MHKNLYLMLDTETAGTLDKPLVYDLGMAIVDKTGKIYKSFSYVIAEIFYGERQGKMQTAYFKDKIPQYDRDIYLGYRTVVSFWYAKRLIAKIIDKYNIKAVVAHNASFDDRALANTNYYLSPKEMESRQFFPLGTELYCTLSMAKSTVMKQASYKLWCKVNGYMTKNNQPRGTAEILYRYITKNNDFIESHTGLQDVLIEKEIFAWCMRQHKKMNTKPNDWYKNKG